MPIPDSLGASARYIEIDLVTGPPAFPLLFRPLFAAKYPSDRSFLAQAVSRTLVAIGGGTVSLIGTDGVVTPDWPMEDGEANGVQAVGVQDAPSGITGLKVLL